MVVIIRELVTPPEKVPTVTDALPRSPPLKLAIPPTQMPGPLAAIVPALVIPAENTEIMTDAVSFKLALLAIPPANMPAPPAEIVPEFVTPPSKVETVMRAVAVSPPAPAWPPIHIPFPPAVIERRVGEDVAILAPHRPGRADFPHPVLRARASLTWRIDGRSAASAMDSA
ncbi:MAG TPA: hypothetical protein VKX28_12635, partial [Xanthobacteraceae bacterium]|nr:hypothetical protein [Xanthobacteraceae bacterium]